MLNLMNIIPGLAPLTGSGGIVPTDSQREGAGTLFASILGSLINGGGQTPGEDTGEAASATAATSGRKPATNAVTAKTVAAEMQGTDSAANDGDESDTVPVIMQFVVIDPDGTVHHIDIPAEIVLDEGNTGIRPSLTFDEKAHALLADLIDSLVAGQDVQAAIIVAGRPFQVSMDMVIRKAALAELSSDSTAVGSDHIPIPVQFENPVWPITDGSSENVESKSVIDGASVDIMTSTDTPPIDMAVGQPEITLNTSISGTENERMTRSSSSSSAATDTPVISSTAVSADIAVAGADKEISDDRNTQPNDDTNELHSLTNRYGTTDPAVLRTEDKSPNKSVQPPNGTQSAAARLIELFENGGAIEITVAAEQVSVENGAENSETESVSSSVSDALVSSVSDTKPLTDTVAISENMENTASNNTVPLEKTAAETAPAAQFTEPTAMEQETDLPYPAQRTSDRRQGSDEIVISRETAGDKESTVIPETNESKQSTVSVDTENISRSDISEETSETVTNIRASETTDEKMFVSNETTVRPVRTEGTDRQIPNSKTIVRPTVTASENEAIHETAPAAETVTELPVAGDTVSSVERSVGTIPNDTTEMNAPAIAGKRTVDTGTSNSNRSVPVASENTETRIDARLETDIAGKSVAETNSTALAANTANETDVPEVILMTSEQTAIEKPTVEGVPDSDMIQETETPSATKTVQSEDVINAAAEAEYAETVREINENGSKHTVAVKNDISSPVPGHRHQISTGQKTMSASQVSAPVGSNGTEAVNMAVNIDQNTTTEAADVSRSAVNTATSEETSSAVAATSTASQVVDTSVRRGGRSLTDNSESDTRGTVDRLIPTAFRRHLAAAEQYVAKKRVTDSMASSEESGASSVESRRTVGSNSRNAAGGENVPDSVASDNTLQSGNEIDSISARNEEKTFAGKEMTNTQAVGTQTQTTGATVQTTETVRAATLVQTAREHSVAVNDAIVRSARIMVQNGESSARIQLEPPSLGKLQLDIVTVNSKVTGRITVENAEVRDIVQNNLSALRDSLVQSGLKVDSFDVQVGHNGGTDGWARMETFRQGRRHTDRIGNNYSTSTELVTTAASTVTQKTVSPYSKLFDRWI